MKKTASFLLAALLLLAPLPSAGAVDVSASSAVLYAPDMARLLFEKNARQRLPVASTTKIMTAILLCEAVPQDKKLVTTAEMVTVEGSSMGLKAGDTVNAQALLYGMLLASGNDAANTAACMVAGGLDKFAALMNKKAKELGMKDTHFVTPSGLDAKDHYSTAYDMALLAAYAMKNPAFKEAARAQAKTVEYGNPPYRRTLKNHNKLLSMYSGAVGVKTGFTKKSGRCLVSAAERGGVTLVGVTLNAPSDWNDHKKLFDHGFSLIKRYDLPTGIAEKTVPLIGMSKERALRLTAKSPAVTLLNEDYPDIRREYLLPRFLYAPVEQGEAVGKIEYYLGGKKIAETEVFAVDSVKSGKLPPLYYGKRFLFWLRLLLYL